MPNFVFVKTWNCCYVHTCAGCTENDTPQYYSKIFISAQNFCMMLFNIDFDLNFNFSVFEGI